MGRERFSLRSICRGLHEPPALKRDCCVRVPEEIIKYPDPATYDVDSVFGAGGTPTFNSPDISTVHVWPMRPIDNLTGVIRNLSADASAQRTRVDMSWSAFGIGLQRLPLASFFVDLARAGFPGSERSVSWPLPPALKDANRYGIFMDIAHPYDRDLTNNAGQQTVDGMQTSQGRSKTFVVPVRNPLNSVQLVNMTLAPEPTASWATVAPAAFSLAPGAQQNVLVSINVPEGEPVSPPGTLVSATIELMAFAGSVLFGGVSFIVLLDA